MFRRRACAFGILTAIVAALSTSATPACAVFGGCDEEGAVECDGDDAVRICQRNCEMRGSPDERCSDDFSWATIECDSRTTCMSDPQGRHGCVVAGTRSCAVEPLPGRAGTVLSADVDGSGTRELVVLEGLRISVDFGGGKVVVSDLTDGAVSGLSSPAIGDFDGDGHVDLAWLDPAAAPLVALGDGLGAFRFAPRATEDVIEGTLLAASDVDGDGKSDLVVSTRRGAAFVAFARGEGRFTHGPETRFGGEDAPRPGAPPPPLFDVYVAADLDGDGILDLLLQDGAITVGRRDGRFEAHGLLPRSSQGMLSSAQTRVGDVDGDGDLDVVTADYQGSRLVSGVFLNDGKGGFQRVPACAPDPGAPGCVVLAEMENLLGMVDVDGDGLADLVASERGRSFGEGPDMLRVRKGRGDGTFDDKGAFFVPTAPRSLVVHDGRLVVGSDLDRALFAVPRSCW